MPSSTAITRIRAKRVYVTCRCSLAGQVLISVRDEGQGFDVRALPDPTDEVHLLLPHGRGIRMIEALMDHVEFLANGAIIQMRKLLGTRTGQ